MIENGTYSIVMRGKRESAAAGAELPENKGEALSSADTGYYYVAKKNPRKMPDKIELKKYDPKARKHVLFKEEKMK